MNSEGHPLAVLDQSSLCLIWPILTVTLLLEKVTVHLLPLLMMISTQRPLEGSIH